VSAGLRYDSFASDALVFSDPTDPGFSHLDGNISPSTLRTAASHHYFSPRFSAAFSANERLSLQFHFGKYVQQVQLRDVYASRAYWNRVLGGGFLINDPRGPNAEPVRATQTVLSVSYQAQPKLHAQASLFYKLTEGHLEGDRIETRPEAAGAEYNILVNSGEATAKGIELSLRYNHQGLGAWMSYALSDVRGFTSYPISNLRDVELEIQDGFHSKTQPPSPLDFNQKHRGHALVAYEFGRRAPIWLRQTGLHLLFHFNSGHHFTLYEGAFG
jgi:outer membrane receptor protein involved in Fe transport